jgi:hypothetical protein
LATAVFWRGGGWTLATWGFGGCDWGFGVTVIGATYTMAFSRAGGGARVILSVRVRKYTNSNTWKRMETPTPILRDILFCDP